MTTTEVSFLGDWGHQWLHIPGDPVVAPRPRVSRWGTYYPKKYQQWMKHIHELLPQQSEEFQEPFSTRSPSAATGGTTWTSWG